METILVTGAHGQLGMCIRNIHGNFPEYRFLFASLEDLDITDKSAVDRFFGETTPGYCINCAAYTHVEQAEKTPEKAFRVNAEGVKYLAGACRKHNTTLIHISTDYVFDGAKTTPYTVADAPGPINEYGKSKLAGERYIEAILNRYFIVRTSWLYSKYGKNFYTIILEKAKTQHTLYVTDQETGCPTNANDAAVFLMRIITSGYKKYGIYHYCGERAMTWYDFAVSILQENGKQHRTKVVRTKNYHTFARRPVYSVLKPSIIHF
ncbi:MAG: dTDP-4-dehydrorhamnose reductase [Sinomicrobium sp.]|nr:dTDP-4-dehydrorhamnose reductase [Sinomicrobium sp.]